MDTTTTVTMFTLLFTTIFMLSTGAEVMSENPNFVDLSSFSFAEDDLQHNLQTSQNFDTPFENHFAEGTDDNHLTSEQQERMKPQQTLNLEEAAAMARHIIRSGKHGTLNTILEDPVSTSDITKENIPFSSLDLFAEDCTSSVGNLVLLLSPMQVSVKNFMASGDRKVSMSVEAKDDFPPSPIGPNFVSLMGHMETLTRESPDFAKARKCYMSRHPEARIWEHIPIHQFGYWRFIVDGVYFGSGHRTDSWSGWIPLDAYRNSSSHTTPLTASQESHGVEELSEF